VFAVAELVCRKWFVEVSNATKRNATKRNETKRNETKTKRRFDDQRVLIFSSFFIFIILLIVYFSARTDVIDGHVHLSRQPNAMGTHVTYNTIHPKE
jgi:heme/copper-type cytochrome/quinol oxidase subunit 3